MSNSTVPAAATGRIPAQGEPQAGTPAGSGGAPGASQSAVSAPQALQGQRQVLGSYLGYVGCFVGAGLISGGVVHYPLDPAHYLTLAAVGTVVFMVATVVNEFVLPAKEQRRRSVLRVVGASLALSLGIGMLSGGIAHFLDFPVRSAILVPAGLLCSFLAFSIRNAASPLSAIVSWTGLGVAVVAVGTLFVLLHTGLHMESEGGAAHSHGESAADTEVPAAPAAPAADAAEDAHAAETADAEQAPAAAATSADAHDENHAH